MKPAAVLVNTCRVNTCRGAVRDTAPRRGFSARGTWPAPGLDVYADEQRVPGGARFRLPGTVLVAPYRPAHQGHPGTRWPGLCAENDIAVLEGRDPPTPVV